MIDHPTYKHLERPIRLGGLTLTQWAYLVGAGFAAFGLSRILPFSDTYNLSVATTLAGTPAAATLAGGMGETHAFAYAAALVRHARQAAVHRPRPRFDPQVLWTEHVPHRNDQRSATKRTANDHVSHGPA